MSERLGLEKYREAVRGRAGALLEGPGKRVYEAIEPSWSAARLWYQRREPREKTLLRVLGAIVAILFVYNVIYRPISGLTGGLQDRVATRQRELVEVRTMMQRWEHLKLSLAKTEKRTVPGGKDFSLFSVLEQTLTKSVGRDKIGSITPTDKPVAGGFVQHTIDLKLTGVDLGQIVNALYGVQTLPVPVTVSNLHIHQRLQDPHSYDVDMTCMALGRNG
ncbi:MAG: type II secretion system protein GspM [Candidatus Binataceae bacterium]